MAERIQAQPARSGSTTASVAGVRPGIAYGRARPRLLRDGFRPVLRAGFNMRTDSCGAHNGCRFEEAEACSGTGLGYCLFHWTRAGRRLTIRTSGDTPVVDRLAWGPPRRR